jgi:hypothetical protein
MTSELKNLFTKSITTDAKGTFFIFAYKMDTTANNIVIIHPPINISSNTSDKDIVKAVALSLTIETDTNTSLNVYINRNLATLSPIKVQKDGTFFVEKIETQQASGTVPMKMVIMHTQQTLSSLDPNGTPAIKNFKVQK